MSEYDKRFILLLCAINIYLCAICMVISLTDKKGFTITNTIRKIFKESNLRPMKSWLQRSDKEMYSKQNEGKSVIAERFIRTLKNAFFKYMTSI